MRIKLKTILCLVFLIYGYSASGQQTKLSTVDVLKGKHQYEREIRYFYEHNWKAFRDEALKLKYISDYQFMTTKADSTGSFTIILITEFPDSLSFKNAEENFRPIIRRLSPGGPKMLNDVKRKDMLEFVSSYTTTVGFKE